MSAELPACEHFIRSRLLSVPALVRDVTGGFHSERLHVSNGRYVLWSFQGTGSNTLGEHGVRILAHTTYLVRVIDKIGSYESLQPDADMIDQALTSAGPMAVQLAGANYTIQSCIQERPFSQTEHYVDTEWRHLGGYYKMDVSPF